MLNGLGGLAGGLAEGLNMGMQWHNQKRYLDQSQERIDQQGKSEGREAEVHGAKMEQYKSEKDLRDRMAKTFQEIADYSQSLTGGGEQPQQQPEAQQPGLGVPAQIQQPGAGLAPQIQPPQAQQAQQPEQPAMPPAKVLERGMLTGAFSPEAMTNIANIYARNGLHEEGVKYMEQAYKARKSGMADAAMSLARNDPGGAVRALKENGIEVDGLPVKVNPRDPEDHNWAYKIKGEGEKEQTVNATRWLQSTFDPVEFLKAEDTKRKTNLDERKQANDDRLTNAQIGSHNSLSQLRQEQAKNAGENSGGGLRSSRSSEAQINTAMNRRDKTFDRKSMTKNIDGEWEQDPEKRQIYESEANKYQNWLEDKLGEEMDAKQQHKLTDVMATFPAGGSPEKIAEWEKGQLLPAFGGRQAAAKQPTKRAESPGLAPIARAKKPAGLKAADKRESIVALDQQMKGIQQALKSPNLNTDQRKALSLKAQEVASKRDGLK